MSLDDDWHYLPTRTRAGALQRGLGRGAVRARLDPAAPDLVYACIRRDHRWLPLDDRGVYLARLVRDLELPVGPIISALYTDADFPHALQVAEVLGRAGSDEIVESLRRYVHIGPHWKETLDAISRTWPANWWDDLLPVAADRLAYATGHSTRSLGALLGDSGGFVEDDAAPVDDCQVESSPEALPAARRVAADPGSGAYWRSLCVLADHGDESDGPALLAGLEWLDGRPDDMCGYDRLVAGLARVGGDAAISALPRIRSLWFSPHSYERAAYLRARMTLEPGACAGALTEGLWDCEASVRLLAVRHVPLDEKLTRRVEYLRDDSLETLDVRAAAAERLMLEASFSD